LALGGVWASRPLWHDNGSHQLERDLESARRDLDELPPATDQALALLESDVPLAEQFPQHLGEMNFLLGSAYLRQAEQASSDNSGPAWQKARFHLEKADALGVPKGDRDHLA